MYLLQGEEAPAAQRRANTHIALHRYFGQSPGQGELRSPQFLPCEFGFLDVRLLTGGVMDLLPQVALGDPGIIVLASEPDQGLANEVTADLAAGRAVKTRTSVRDVPEHAPARFIIDRKRKSHLIRARTQSEVDALSEALRRGFIPGQYSAWQPPMNLTMWISLDVNVPGRCAAKMALNMACAAFGPDAVLDVAFDPVRAYILGEDVISGEGVGANGERGARIDHRFVDPRIGVARKGARRSTDTHGIVLFDRRGTLAARLALFGGMEELNVRLGSVTPPTSELLPLVVSREPDSDWWLPLVAPELSWRHGERPRIPLFGGVAAPVTQQSPVPS